MLDLGGNLIDKKDHQHFLLLEIEEDATIAVTSKFCSMEMQGVETLLDAAHQDDGRHRPVFTPSPRKVDQMSTVLSIISPTLDNTLLYYSHQDRADMVNFKSSVG